MASRVIFVVLTIAIVASLRADKRDPLRGATPAPIPRRATRRHPPADGPADDAKPTPTAAASSQPADVDP